MNQPREEQGESCQFCEMRAILQGWMGILDALPEVGSDFYDEPISEIYNAIDDAMGRWACYHSPEYYQPDV